MKKLSIGLLAGAYSSIFSASPILGMLKEREPRYRMYRGSHATGIELERLVLGGAPTARRDTVRVRADASADQIVLAPTQSTPESLLTHPPRPRKKKRRAS